MPSKSFGTKLQIGEHILVGDNDEIPKGHLAYVFNQSTAEYDVIWDRDWEAFLAGDISKLKSEIEKGIPGAKVRWVNFAWDRTTQSDPFFDVLEMRWKFAYHVYGFKVEAVVENENANLTGLEIVVIIIAVAFFAVVIASIALTVWTTWKVIGAAEQIGPIATVGVGLFIIVIMLVFMALLFGVGFKGKRGKSEVSAKK